MTERERLIKLLEEAPQKMDCPQPHEVADFLLANGVILPPVKIGDTVYYITGIHGTIIKPAKVEEIYIGDAGFAYHVFGNHGYFTLQQDETYFTREDAEKALEELSKHDL